MDGSKEEPRISKRKLPDNYLIKTLGGTALVSERAVPPRFYPVVIAVENLRNPRFFFST
jgi:hypothetical protein